MIATKTRLKCHVSPGQFTNEFAVAGSDFEGAQFSLFVDKVRVEVSAEPDAERTVDGWIDVDVLEELADLALIRLPGRTFGNGGNVTVKRSQLVAARSPSDA